VSFDPLAPYGPVIESTVRVVTWNVWGRFGPDWAARETLLESAAAAAEPDLVCLTESWRQGDVTQAGLVAGRLGLGHHCFAGDWQQDGWVSGIGVASRWPVSEPERRPLRALDGAGAGVAVHVSVAGERGAIQLYVVMLDYPLGASGIRQAQVRQLAEFVAETAPRRDLVVVCGDFNAGVDEPAHGEITSPDAHLTDSWDLARKNEPSSGTVHNFTGKSGSHRIDWIIVSPQVLPQEIHIDRYNKDGRWPSDHFAVWAEVEVR